MTLDNEKMNTEGKAMAQKLNYGLLLMPSMPDSNSHAYGMWKIVTGWTL